MHHYSVVKVPRTSTPILVLSVDNETMSPKLGGSPGLAVKVVGSNPGTGYWMDIFSQLSVVRIVMCVFEKDENKRKRGRGWPIKKPMSRKTLS